MCVPVPERVALDERVGKAGERDGDDVRDDVRVCWLLLERETVRIMECECDADAELENDCSASSTSMEEAEADGELVVAALGGADTELLAESEGLRVGAVDEDGDGGAEATTLDEDVVDRGVLAVDVHVDDGDAGALAEAERVAAAASVPGMVRDAVAEVDRVDEAAVALGVSDSVAEAVAVAVAVAVAEPLRVPVEVGLARADTEAVALAVAGRDKDAVAVRDPVAGALVVALAVAVRLPLGLDEAVGVREEEGGEGEAAVAVREAEAVRVGVRGDDGVRVALAA